VGHDLLLGLCAGFRSNGAPGCRGYAPGYYAAYVLDPNGNNVEARCRGIRNPGLKASPTIL
jgi:hypothetical protein